MTEELRTPTRYGLTWDETRPLAVCTIGECGQKLEERESCDAKAGEIGVQALGVKTSRLLELPIVFSYPT